MTLRGRLRLRIGQRFSRDALPAALVEQVQRPLIRKVVGRNATTREVAKVFTDWLLYPRGDKYQLIAIIDPARSQAEGDDACEALAQHFPDELNELLSDDSGALTMEN